MGARPKGVPGVLAQRLPASWGVRGLARPAALAFFAPSTRPKHPMPETLWSFLPLPADLDPEADPLPQLGAVGANPNALSRIALLPNVKKNTFHKHQLRAAELIVENYKNKHYATAPKSAHYVLNEPIELQSLNQTLSWLSLFSQSFSKALCMVYFRTDWAIPGVAPMVRNGSAVPGVARAPAR